MPEYKEVDYMGGSVRVVTDPDGFVQHITDPGEFPDYLQDAWCDYQKAQDAFFSTPVNDEKIIAAGKKWERFGRILIGYAGTMFNIYQDDPEKRRMILDIYDRFSKDMAIIRQNISKYRELLNAAEAPAPEALQRADDAKIESSRTMLRALNTQIRFRKLYENGENYSGPEAQMEKSAAERSEQLFAKIPETRIYLPAMIYPPIPLPEEGRVQDPPEAFLRMQQLPAEDLEYDTDLDEFVIRQGYVSGDGLIDDQSVVWHPEDSTVVMKLRGGKPVIWPYWKPKDASDMPERESRVVRYVQRYYRQCLADREAKIFDPGRTAVIDEGYWKRLVVGS